MSSRLYTAEECHKALLREINYRKYVYEKRVGRGEMKQSLADEQIAIFEQIAGHYAEMAQKERLL